MGEDGHTASIFNGPDLEDALTALPEQKAVGVMPDKLVDIPPTSITLSEVKNIACLVVASAMNDGRVRAAS